MSVRKRKFVETSKKSHTSEKTFQMDAEEKQIWECFYTRGSLESARDQHHSAHFISQRLRPQPVLATGKIID